MPRSSSNARRIAPRSCRLLLLGCLAGAAALVVTLLFRLIGPGGCTGILSFASIPFILVTRGRSRILATLSLISAVLFFFILASSYSSATIRAGVLLKILEPGTVVVESQFTTGRRDQTLGLGCTAHAVFAEGSWFEMGQPTLQWVLPAHPMTMWSNGEESLQASALITVGPREQLQHSPNSTTPFMIERLAEPGGEGHVQVRLQLPTPEPEQDVQLMWGWDPSLLSEWGTWLDWESENLSCLCEMEGVASYSVSSGDSAVLEIGRGPTALVPLEPASFWLDYPATSEIGYLSLTTLASENPGFLENTYDLSRDYISPDLQSVADVWRELSTDTSSVPITAKRLRTEQGPFLLLGTEGTLRIGDEVVHEFDSAFFAIVEPWLPYGEFYLDSLILSFLTLNDEWACECPLLWVFGSEPQRSQQLNLTIRNSIGWLRTRETTYEFEEIDVLRIALSEVSFTNRRTQPFEYLLLGETSSLSLNERELIWNSRWSQLPSAVQQVLLALFSAALAGAIGVAVALVRRSTS